MTGVRTVLDVGCGEGHSTDFFYKLLNDQIPGVTVVGVDGVEQDNPLIVQHDFTTGPLRSGPFSLGRHHFDIVWSCEFVEHVEERYLPNILDAFCMADMVLMTHAFPGQPGYHHVNCQFPDYWLGAMAAVGYEYDQGTTTLARRLAGIDNPNNHFKRSGLVFCKYP